MINVALQAAFALSFSLMDLLFAPATTFSPSDRLPSLYGTANDCAIAVRQHDPATLWQGRISGRISGSRPNMRQVSRVACFTSEAVCARWLAEWSGRINGTIIQNSCRRGVR